MNRVRYNLTFVIGVLCLFPLISGARGCGPDGVTGGVGESGRGGIEGKGGSNQSGGVGESGRGGIQGKGGFNQSGGAGGNPVTDAGHIGAGAGGAATDAGLAPEACGSTSCKPGEFCCNASCGICAPAGGVCTMQACAPAPKACDSSDCGPAMGLLTKFCPNGTTAGPSCERGADGSCRWVVTKCSETFPDAPCGGCSHGDYCEVANCGRNGEKGICTPQPAECDYKENDYVCGCDGNTYLGACKAHAIVSVDYVGRCVEVCPDGYADCDGERINGCETALGTPENCGACGDSCAGNPCVKGVCVLTCPTGYGNCDNRVANGCETALTTAQNCGACGNACGGAACVDGACSTEKLSCGGFAGFRCPSEEYYCDYAAGNGCDVADGMGLCKLKPQACTMQYDPVCGCDNTTYGNACSAAGAGASIRYHGECKKAGCTFGQNQTCNDSPIFSSYRGRCNQDGTCTCDYGYSSETGKCL